MFFAMALRIYCLGIGTKSGIFQIYQKNAKSYLIGLDGCTIKDNSEKNGLIA